MRARDRSSAPRRGDGRSGHTPARADSARDRLQSLQQAAGNAAVTHLLEQASRAEPPAAQSAPEPVMVSRWATLGEQTWMNPFGGKVRRQVIVGDEAEWRARLSNMDDEDEADFARGFLEAVNDPGVLGRTRHPNGWDGYTNTIVRLPTDAEVMMFMRALYGLAGDLDLPNTWRESGPFVRWVRREFAGLIEKYQGRVIVEVSQAGRRISPDAVAAVSEQGGEELRAPMIANAGATAMKGVELVKAANLKPAGNEREVARSRAFEVVRNSGRTIRAVLQQHDDEIAFQQSMIAMVFESVWEMIPADKALAVGAKEFLKLGLSKMLQSAAANDEPKKQAEAIFTEFVPAVQGLVPGGHLDANDANGVITGFEAALK
jgi:hypothetical protein